MEKVALGLIPGALGLTGDLSLPSGTLKSAPQYLRYLLRVHVLRQERETDKRMKEKPVTFGLMYYAQGGASYGDGAQITGRRWVGKTLTAICSMI